jgi:thioesterase III
MMTTTMTSAMPKVLSSTATIRFQDCDPFNHLNNARYVDYFLNAREDQIQQHYGLNIHKVAAEQGVAWVVGRNQIAYLKPARLNEEVIIESQLLRHGERDILVEMRMFDNQRTQLKAFLWMNLVHFRIQTGRSEVHSQEFQSLFSQVHEPMEASNFDDRFMELCGISQNPRRN